MKTKAIKLLDKMIKKSKPKRKRNKPKNQEQEVAQSLIRPPALSCTRAGPHDCESCGTGWAFGVGHPCKVGAGAKQSGRAGGTAEEQSNCT